MNSLLAGCHLAELTRLHSLTPEQETLGHLFLRCRCIVKEGVGLQDVLREGMCYPPWISVQAGE
jgi:hypothetical protein